MTEKAEKTSCTDIYTKLIQNPPGLITVKQATCSR